MNIKRKIKDNLIHLPGFRTNRKIVVIESDDWGSIRMSSTEALNRLLAKGIKLDINKNNYDRLDTIASPSDMERLFETLQSVKDKNNNPAIITANSLVANPDFDKIKSSDYTEYHYEPITETMNRYYSQSSPFALWQEGMKSGVFYPQFHGREHLNVFLWLQLLRKNAAGVREAFDENVFCQRTYTADNSFITVLPAYNYNSEKERIFKKNAIHEGLALFEQLFGYRSLSAIAPCYTWDNFIEQCYLSEGIQYIQGSLYQTFTSWQKQQSNKKGKYHYMGQTNKLGQIYLIRNCMFEPSQYPTINSVDNCLYKIKLAFRWKKPAIISAHRLNFIGGLDVKNRDENLKSLSYLLKQITKQWADVEFMTSDSLGNIIKKNLKN